MVKISALKPYLPNSPETFCTNPYDIIGKEEEKKLKQNLKSLIHLILPDGEGEELYQNGFKSYQRFKSDNLITQESNPSIFVYRQESTEFSQQGFILGLSLQDYEDGNIVKHEHTREKPLKDRTKHIVSTNVAAGLVWSVYRSSQQINSILEQIKKKKPMFDFMKYGYQHILWKEDDPLIINELKNLFEKIKVFIADGHHRAASAAEYRKLHLGKTNGTSKSDDPWQYLLSYVASDDQVRILPYNRVIRKINTSTSDFLKKLNEIYEVNPVEKAFNPEEKHQIALCLKGNWYKLTVKTSHFETEYDGLDVTILQDKILKPVLGITDPRSDKNLFFVGGIQDPNEIEKYITLENNDCFFNLYPVDIKNLESIAESGGVMPPKSTWFDPKVLSGLVLHELKEN
jgi:uncharacterized protein (DUF1015 family)